MDVHQIQATSDYILEARGRGVMAISPAALAARIGVDVDTATGLLLHAQKFTGAVDIKGFIECPHCGERIALQEHTADGLINEAASLSGAACPYCDNPLEQPRVRLSFFFDKRQFQLALN